MRKNEYDTAEKRERWNHQVCHWLFKMRQSIYGEKILRDAADLFLLVVALKLSSLGIYTIQTLIEWQDIIDISERKCSRTLQDDFSLGRFCMKESSCMYTDISVSSFVQFVPILKSANQRNLFSIKNKAYWLIFSVIVARIKIVLYDLKKLNLYIRF